MRLFDITGAVFVTGWLVFAGAYVYHHESKTDQKQTDRSPSSDIGLEEGNAWWLLRRSEEYVGFIRRSRTRLPDGWLVEYDLVAAIDILGGQYAFDLELKAKLDGEAYLRTFDGTLQAGNRELEAQGTVHDDEVALVIDPGSEPIRRSLSLDERPRLVSNSIHEVAKEGSLEPGQRIRRDFFDPTSMGMARVELEFLGRKTVSLYEGETDARHFRQHVAGRALDVYTDDSGEVLVQELPFETVALRVDNDLGRARAPTLRQKAREVREENRKSGSGIDRMLQFMGLGEPVESSSDSSSDNSADSSSDRSAGSSEDTSADTSNDSDTGTD